ncbi:hypothetical protein MBRA1_003884 [Malassezia brasiliensis]|uniref:Protein lifeguard 4 n=1 Tax=Malassezia brasiliensis TaxID=1821822 RepID=A0AAF0IUS0_9BASI|nr:hypothetical protein MBRA1_003884 [Malassezia brasiliensis]
MPADAPPPYTYQSIPHDEEAQLADSDAFKLDTTVEQSDPEVRALFVRKVYTVLFLQLVGTAAVAAAMSTSGAVAWVTNHPALLLVPLVGSLATLGALYWKSLSHPANLILLALFTLMESLLLGAIVAVADRTAVLQAVVLSAVVFGALSLYTLQTRHHFASLASYLYYALMLLVGIGLVQLVLPYSHTFELVYSVAGCAVFSGYILFDTYLLQQRLSPDAWVLANVSLYLDVLNLFLSVLRLLNATSDD